MRYYIEDVKNFNCLTISSIFARNELFENETQFSENEQKIGDI